jgi:NAD(P)-dependent dehydrogenase (short-subunit alcohol dehydrogenase family)
MGRLEGKTAVITGGVQGIGRGCALRCAAEGARIVVVDLQSDTGTVDEIKSNGGEAMHVVADVRSAADWERVVAEATSAFGQVDLLANVAGVVNMETPDTVIGLSEDAWQTVIDTDLKGVWLGMRAVLPGMIESGWGSIVNIASLSAYKAHANLASYAAAKAGVLGLTQQAAVEYAGDGIRVNCICPGTIDTPILDGITPELKKTSAEAHILKRLGKPSDIAAMMVLYFSEDGSFLTGNIAPVDGGWLANGRAQ